MRSVPPVIFGTLVKIPLVRVNAIRERRKMLDSAARVQASSCTVSYSSGSVISSTS